MFLRVRDFGVTHRQQFPESSTAGQAFTAVAAAAADLEAKATAKLLAADEGRKAKAAVRDAILDRLTALERTARLAAKSAPGTDRVFQLPQSESDVALLTAARAFITEGQAAMERLVPLGLPATFVSELQALVDRLQQTLDGSRAGKTGVATAQAGFKTAMAQGLNAVRTLDVVVSNMLKTDPERLSLWKHDRRVTPKGKGSGQNRPGPATAPQSDDAPTATAAENTLRKVS